MGSTPTQKRWTQSDDGYYPDLEPYQVHHFIDGITPLGDDYEPKMLLEFPPLRGQNFAGTADEISPTQKQQRKLNKPLHIQLNHTRDRDQYSEEAWSYQFQKPIAKASQARSKH